MHNKIFLVFTNNLLTLWATGVIIEKQSLETLTRFDSFKKVVDEVIEK
jgi:hypothetical protein